ncbi:MAG: hypothetical protein AVO35_11780 [Candidatus Aegiribacteria sp. MLS_C]|nr:MAG: hypothetical protein AVO35_11780 [Candidatus Aegiribacteria sp. MLS_C]
MKKNVGRTDRIVRASLAVLVGILYLAGVIEGTPAIVLGVVALALLFTSVTGFCSFYVPFGISTVKEKPMDRD